MKKAEKKVKKTENTYAGISPVVEVSIEGSKSDKCSFKTATECLYFEFLQNNP